MSPERASNDQKVISAQLQKDLVVVVNALKDSSRFKRMYVLVGSLLRSLAAVLTFVRV